MNKLQQKTIAAKRRQNRVRKSLTTSSDAPRLSVRISNLHVTAQIIDNTADKTLAYATTVGNKKATGTMTEKAIMIGQEIAKKAEKVKVKKVVFDRGDKLYHGRVKALADAARESGLEF